MRNLVYLLVLFILTILFWGCENRSTEGTEKITIVATTGMIGDAVSNLVPDGFKVKTIMGPGVDPHLYKATGGDLNLLREADVVFYNGLHLEGKMGEILEKFGRQKSVIAVTEGMEAKNLRDSKDFPGNIDPHIWFDVKIWKEAVKNIAEGLVSNFPDNSEVINKNLSDYLVKLDSLEIFVRKNIESIPPEHRVLVTAHDAFGYFGKAYGVDVRGLQGISTLSEYGVRDISNMIGYITSHNIKAVFVESSVPEKALKAVVEGCRSKGHEVRIGGTLYSDALGEENSPEGNYIGMFRYNVRTITTQLKGVKE